MKRIISLLTISLCCMAMCKADENKELSTTNSQSPFYQSYIELSARLTSVSSDAPLYTLECPVAGGAAIDMINGCRLNKYVYLGGGIGVTSYFLNAKIKSLSKNIAYLEMVSSPIYADLRVFFNSADISPYVEVAVGPLLQYHSYGEILDYKIYPKYSTMAYFKTCIGMDIINRFTLGIGYELWGDKNDVMNFGFVKFGVRIGQSKNVY